MSDPLFAGGLAGAAWSTLNLWCLARLLRAWLVPPPARGGVRRQGASSTRLARVQSACAGHWQVAGWLLAKFPLLYAAAWLYLSRPGASVVGFGAGFTLVLLAAMAWFLFQAQRMTLLGPHGR